MERELKSKSSLTDLHNMIRRGKKYLSLLLFVLIFMSCGSSKEIIEDFRTNMYIDRMEQFSKKTLSGGEIVFSAIVLPKVASGMSTLIVKKR